MGINKNPFVSCKRGEYTISDTVNQSKIIGKLSKSVANELIHNIAPQYSSRNGGYTRVIKLDNRKNDDAIKALIEFVSLENSENEEEVDKTDSTKIIKEKKDK